MAAEDCVKGAIALRSCAGCGHVFNSQFDASLLEYDTLYDNSLDFSPAFQKYAEGLAKRLINQYELRHKSIVEIGCGQGTFLKLLCRLGSNIGTGYDPTLPADSDPVLGVSLVKDYFRCSKEDESVNFFCCRHVLEHFETPLEFLVSLSGMRAAKAGAVFYFEVPNSEFLLREQPAWDVIYPHISYFTERSLRNLFKRAGFEVLNAGKTFSDQFLFVEARANPGASNGFPGGMSEAVTAFDGEASAFRRYFGTVVKDWARLLGRLAGATDKFAFWGVGAKGVTFLNLVEGADKIGCLIDSNPRKQGKYVPGTGQLISKPEALRDFRPSSIILLNSAYRQEISSALTHMGLAPKIITEPEVLL